jgi:hypothetical protein
LDKKIWDLLLLLLDFILFKVDKVCYNKTKYIAIKVKSNTEIYAVSIKKRVMLNGAPRAIVKDTKIKIKAKVFNRKDFF